ncbi:N-acetylmuramoyl-L-alanine amidase [Desulfococcaceae bacterium HSG9]|nr:N-acetylmuramoyl-L-alanine amidase [Desulfococcaceae bacterium HSG9]
MSKHILFILSGLFVSLLLLIWPSSILANQIKTQYINAEKCYAELHASPTKQKYRNNWLMCIEQFQTIYKQAPSGRKATACLYMSGKLYQELYQISAIESDRTEAIDLFIRILKRFPDSEYKDKAIVALRIFSKEDSKRNKTTRPLPPTGAKDSLSQLITEDGKAADKEKKPTKTQIQPRIQIPAQDDLKDTASTGQYSVVTGLRFWSNPSYTRVVIDADKEINYLHELIPKKRSINKPHRLYIDLSESILKQGFKKFVSINDHLLIDVRASQRSLKTVRVVIDIKSYKRYKIFSLKHPFRIVVDVWGKESEKTVAKHKGSVTPKIKGKQTIARQFALGVRRIVIDPGHGGHDFGAPGYRKGVHEKDVVLAISKKLARKMRRELKCEVIMTRTKDRFISLEERTALANTKNADLFISIHTNGFSNRRAYGIETYFLNLATDKDAMRVAARENATTTKNISDLQTILTDLMKNAKINESSRMAGYVQKSLYRTLRKKYSHIKNKGVKQAPFYVLIGAQMPSILVETSFISNPRECKRLTSPTYQKRLCDAIIQGVKEYIRSLNPTAFRRKSQLKRSSS